MNMKGKKIVLGITGSIAAYKAAILIRSLIKKGAEVQVVITPAGKEFITPITLSALTSKPVISEFFSQRDGTWHSHVDLGLWADAMVIAPATASTIGKMAHGVADNMLITTYLSMKAPVFVAPAMDLDMFAHPSTQKNLDILRSYGNHIIEPGEGELASHLVGKGRMEEPEKIVEVLEAFFAQQQDLKGKKVVITAGPTYEKIDPVRFIGNYSSGKMGYALAEECAARGAEVVLVSGPVTLQAHHPNICRVDVESAQEMYEAAKEAFVDADAGILCAAVADFTPDQAADHKIKREKDDLNITLYQNLVNFLSGLNSFDDCTYTEYHFTFLCHHNCSFFNNAFALFSAASVKVAPLNIWAISCILSSSFNCRMWLLVPVSVSSLYTL